jgi:hypothetical protein
MSQSRVYPHKVASFTLPSGVRNDAINVPVPVGTSCKMPSAISRKHGNLLTSNRRSQVKITLAILSVAAA